MGGLVRAGAVWLLLIAAGGCAPLNSVYWRMPGPGESRVITTDAFQRHLIMTRDREGQIRACSEASPDAMTVFSSALSGRGIFGPTEREVEAAAAIGQTAATIERTQTINMLREWMYRTCELWLSGAINDDEFLIRSARDHRSMIAILAVEQLTGVVKPPATVISGPAVTAARAQSEQTVDLINAYRKERETAEAAEKAAADDFAAANVEHDDGKGTKKKICEFDSAPENGVDAYNKCKAAEQKAASAKAAADAARDREKQVLAQLESLTAGIAAAVSGGSFNAGGVQGGVSRMTDEQLTIVASTVEEITKSIAFDESVVFCLSYLYRIREEMTDTVVDTCNKILVARFVNDERARAGLESVDVAGTNITVTPYRAPAPDDIATPIVRAYLAAAGAEDAERRRRLQLAARLAVELNLIQSTDQITNLVFSGDPNALARLLARLRLADQTEAGQAALAPEQE